MKANPLRVLVQGQSAVVILDDTPFYAESGGQIGDRGCLIATNMRFDVKDTQKYGQVFGHIGTLIQGTLNVGQTINAVVDTEHRTKTSLNHSATHLLHAALRQSIRYSCCTKRLPLVSDTILRFDFAQPEAIRQEQLLKLNAS